eukprot:12951823-Alexandrium_andersonii.AAC.1
MGAGPAICLASRWICGLGKGLLGPTLMGARQSLRVSDSDRASILPQFNRSEMANPPGSKLPVPSSQGNSRDVKKLTMPRTHRARFLIKTLSG